MSLVPSPANATTLAALKERTKNLPPETPLSFFSAGGLDLMQRAAMMLARSTLVPPAYREFVQDKKTEKLTENPSAVSNCVLALNMAQRIGADPLMIMQNLYLVEGRPGWSSQFVIASINACGKFSPLRFRMEDKGEKEAQWTTTKWVDGPNGRRVPKEEIHKAKIRDLACTAWAIEKDTGETLEGPTVSMDMAIAEGWFGKNGSKWQTMPEVMLRYRAASFFGKLYAPELLMGLQTAEEVNDSTITLEPGKDGAFEMTLADLEPSSAPEVHDLPGEPAPPKKEKLQARTAQAAPEIQAETQETPATSSQPVAPAPPLEPGDILCPKTGPDGQARIVEKQDCARCPDRKGCPSLPEE